MSLGSKGPPKIWDLQKFLRDCFQNLAQRFIRIEEYLKKIVLKKEWPSDALGDPKFLKIQKFFTNYS